MAEITPPRWDWIVQEDETGTGLMVGFRALWPIIRAGDQDRVLSTKALRGTFNGSCKAGGGKLGSSAPEGETAMKTPSQPTHVVDQPALKRKLAQWARTHPELRSWLELINQELRHDHVILDPPP